MKRTGMTNEVRRAESIRRIIAAIPECEQRIEVLAGKAKVSQRVCRKIIYDEKYLFIREMFEAVPYVDPYEKARKEKADFLEKVIPKAKGDFKKLKKQSGYAISSLRAMISDERYPALKTKWNEEREKNGWSFDIRKRLEEVEGSESYNPDFQIDSVKHLFLPHQIEFAYLKPDEVKHPALVGGFGSGKTMSIPLRWLKLIEFRKSQIKKCSLMVLEPTTEMLRDIIVPCFDEFFEKLGVPVKFLSEKKVYHIMYGEEKHSCIFRSADRPRSLTGKNLTDIIIDEFDRIPYHKQKILWRECISRIRKAEFGTCGVVTTPEGFKMTYELWGNT